VGSIRRFWRVLDDVDVVWVLGPYPLAIVFALLARLRRRAVVLGVRQDLPEYVRARRTRRRALLGVAIALDAVWRAMARRLPVVVVGPALARKYRRGRRVLDVFVSLVPCDAVASAAPPRRAAGAAGRRLLAVGRLDPEKNPLLLADTLAGLNADGPAWRLTVCGDGPLTDALRDRLHDLGQAEHAELLGHVPAGEALWRLYRESDALLHVSLTEGFPQVLLEAFATGLPVVATAVGGIAEGASGAAELVPPADAAAAVAAVRRIAADDARRRARVESGLRLARRHTLEAEAARVAGLLHAAACG
jgi:glycosyltransferase involved in cell wall biosynthesis